MIEMTREGETIYEVDHLEPVALGLVFRDASGRLLLLGATDLTGASFRMRVPSPALMWPGRMTSYRQPLGVYHLEATLNGGWLQMAVPDTSPVAQRGIWLQNGLTFKALPPPASEPPLLEG